MVTGPAVAEPTTWFEPSTTVNVTVPAVTVAVELTVADGGTLCAEAEKQVGDAAADGAAVTQDDAVDDGDDAAVILQAGSLHGAHAVFNGESRDIDHRTRADAHRYPN